jgi:predicted alpha/beta superfamily hydrolase
MRQRLSIIIIVMLCGNCVFAQKRSPMLSKNVCILDTAFYMPQLNRNRRIWIYLPKTYCSSRKRYPVLYMQDGQNLFDESTAFAGEWGVDESLDTLAPSVGEAIVVAIDNGGEKRINEYVPYDTPEHGRGEGIRYLDFIVQTLKPFVDKHYRTKRSAKFTSIAGSSLGGLISFYAMLHYPSRFGAAGVFSPAFWIAPALKTELLQKGKRVKGRLYFYAGKQESAEMLPDMLAVFETLNKYSKAKMTTVIRTEGKHDEASWRKEFPLFFTWLLSPASK